MTGIVKTDQLQGAQSSTIAVPSGNNLTVGGTLGVTGETTLATHLNLGDNDRIKLGAGSDIQIYHDGTYSRIMESGGTALILDTTSANISLTADNSENMAKFIKNGAVQLFYDNSQKLSTTSSGVTITGAIRVGADNAANDLDDYEEGIWTPSFVGLSNTPVNVANIGRYTKIGNLVHVQFNYQSGGTSPTFSSNTAELQVSGLPFASTGGYYTAGTGSVASQTFNFQGSNNNQGLNGDLVVSAIAGSNIVFKVVTNGSNRSNVRNSSITGGAILETSLTYRTT